ncbi:helix-turn-helix domain-containing protein [Streptomyces sp. NPDC057253]|uniref:helix-turn-helix domain-containing protein n=1 Tax=Streptomyces sp. NPDC057253 TaxID=3346069 RepID=UPI003628DAC4
MNEEPEPAGDVGAALVRSAELSEFLRSRRARLKLSDVGLPDQGRFRRVPGLRREELAELAGVSLAYYTRLEQGHAQNASAEILDAIAGVLRLSEAERLHLADLAGPRRQTKKKGPFKPAGVRKTLNYLIDSMEHVPAYVIGGCSDIVAWNAMAAALFGDWSELPENERNWARLVFLRPAFRDLFVNWESKAAEVVNYLRMTAGRQPEDGRLSALVGELQVRSAEFRQMWARYEVQNTGFGTTRMCHPLVGDLTLSFETFRVADDPHQILITFQAEPGTPSAEALRWLASWGAGETAAGVTESQA